MHYTVSTHMNLIETPNNRDISAGILISLQYVGDLLSAQKLMEWCTSPCTERLIPGPLLKEFNVHSRAIVRSNDHKMGLKPLDPPELGWSWPCRAHPYQSDLVSTLAEAPRCIHGEDPPDTADGRLCWGII